MTHPCPGCGKDVPDERRDLLGVETCVDCTPQKPRPKGYMVYDHKTGGVMETCSDEQHAKMSAHNDPSKDDDLEDFTP